MRCLNNVMAVIWPQPGQQLRFSAPEACRQLHEQMGLHTTKFPTWQEGDAHEWISTLIGILEDYLVWTPLQRNRRQTTKCSTCGHASSETRKQVVASLPIDLPEDNANSAGEGLRVHAFEDLFNTATEWPADWRCPSCLSETAATCRAPFMEAPAYVMCNLVRFHSNGAPNLSLVQLARQIDMQRLIEEEDPNAGVTSTTYELIGVGVRSSNWLNIENVITAYHPFSHSITGADIGRRSWPADRTRSGS